MSPWQRLTCFWIVAHYKCTDSARNILSTKIMKITYLQDKYLVQELRWTRFLSSKATQRVGCTQMTWKCRAFKRSVNYHICDITQLLNKQNLIQKIKRHPNCKKLLSISDQDKENSASEDWKRTSHWHVVGRVYIGRSPWPHWYVLFQYGTKTQPKQPHSRLSIRKLLFLHWMDYMWQDFQMVVYSRTITHPVV
jgi:hypothetical protein